MSDEEKIESLEGELIEANYQLKKAKDKEMIYLDMLSNINNSLNVLFKREAENERFNLGDNINFRECVVNLKAAFDDFIRIYKLRL